MNIHYEIGYRDKDEEKIHKAFTTREYLAGFIKRLEEQDFLVVEVCEITRIIVPTNVARGE